VRHLIRSRQVDTVHDCSDGGLLLAVAEMAMAGGVGATITGEPDELPLHAFLFGEDQGRYVLACDPDEAADLLYEANAVGVPALLIGVTGGDSLILPSREAISVAELKAPSAAPCGQAAVWL
jgi:phosphoribosylformylglycinamidine (FGAM) synthase-like enzyme